MKTNDAAHVAATNELFNGVMQYFVLPPKKQRDREKFDRNNAETFRIFGFDQKEGAR